MQTQQFRILLWKTVKKMPKAVDNSTEYNPKSVQLYNSIRKYAAAGYSKREISKILHCGRNTVTKYLNGDYESLCKRDYRSGMDQFYDDIVKELNAGVSRKDVYCHLLKKGYKGKHSAAYDYMNKIIKRDHIDIAVYKSSSAEVIQKRKKLQQYDHISRTGIFRFLWMNADLSKAHCSYIMEHYPRIRQLDVCIREFRNIYNQKNMVLLYLFIEKYKRSEIQELSHFAEGLEKDIEAVENSVASPLSNGFVEGTNNKLKMIKRTMYGRCSRQLLEAKLMYRPNV